MCANPGDMEAMHNQTNLMMMNAREDEQDAERLKSDAEILKRSAEAIKRDSEAQAQGNQAELDRSIAEIQHLRAQLAGTAPSFQLSSVAEHTGGHPSLQTNRTPQGELARPSTGKFVCCPLALATKAPPTVSEDLVIAFCPTCGEGESYVNKGKDKAVDGPADGPVDGSSRHSSSQGKTSTLKHRPASDGTFAQETEVQIQGQVCDKDTYSGKCCELANDENSCYVHAQHEGCRSPETVRKPSIFSCNTEDDAVTPFIQEHVPSVEIAEACAEILADQAATANSIHDTEDNDEQEVQQTSGKYAQSPLPEQPTISEPEINISGRESHVDAPSEEHDIDNYTPNVIVEEVPANSDLFDNTPPDATPRTLSRWKIRRLERKKSRHEKATQEEAPPISELDNEAPSTEESQKLSRCKRKKLEKEKAKIEKAAQKEVKKKEKLEKAARKRGEAVDGAADDPILPAGEHSFQTYHTAVESLSPISRQLDGNFSTEVDSEAQGSRDSQPFEHIRLTEADSKIIRRKTDKVILVILIWVYFLQIIDKTVLGYGTLFGLQEDTGLVRNQYSMVGSIAPIAQLAWQPFSSVLIVKIPHRILMPCLVLGWGIAQASMAACHNYSGLLLSRFFLGLFEAGCLPLFSVITNQWYRRSEQPLRIAAWYSMNGLGTIVASLLAYGAGHILNDTLKSWQILFLFVGAITILSVPFIYWKLDNDVTSARFLTDYEKTQAVERLRANQTGIGSRKFDWNHLSEVLLEPKTYLWFSMSLLVNVGASVTNVFGPLILSGLGYDNYITTLLNIPFGGAQVAAILLASYAAYKAKVKSGILVALVFPVIAGLSILYAIPRANDALLLFGYYLLPFLFGSNPLIVSWIIGNTAGTTKKSIVMSLYTAGSSAGNIIGPLLFSSKDAPEYHSGLRAVLGIFVALAAIIVIQLLVLFGLNRRQEKIREAKGKPKILRDVSMEDRYMEFQGGEHSFDLTDGKNDEFVFIY